MNLILNFLPCLAFLVFIQPGYGALPGLKCIAEYSNGPCGGGSGCNFTDPDNLFYLACGSDCRANHNAEGGRCTRKGFCTCGDVVKSVNTGSLQCLDIKQAEFYQNICFEDCQCAHNAKGGGCNFYTKGCECGEIAEKFSCPYKSSNEYFLNLISKYSTVGIDLVSIYVGASNA